MSVSHESASESTCGAIERVIVERLQQEGIIVQRIGHDDLLFELGMDSVIVGLIIDDLERAFQKAVKPEAIFELETIREIGEHLDELPLLMVSADSTEARPATQDRLPIASAKSTPPSGDPIECYRRLNRKVNEAKQQGLYLFEPQISSHDGAWVQCEGKRMLMLASYEYLGLLGDERLDEAAEQGIQTYGTGHHGSRLLTGTTSLHMELESRLASLMDADDAIVFSSGYVANLSTITALVGRGDYVIGDSLNHASIIDGCQMSGADFVDFDHNNMQALAGRLEQSRGRRTLVVVDAVFSMEGDIINLPGVIELCEAHNAMLMVDEAHSLGVLGKTGRGVQEHFGVDARKIHIKMGTLSKSLAGTGGFVAGDEALITYLRHHARGYIFSGALPAAYANVSLAALRILECEPARVVHLRAMVEHYLKGLQERGFDTGKCESPIVPIMCSSNEETMAFAKGCREAGLLVAPVCYPAVPMDSPRLRTCITAIHQPQDIDFALDVLSSVGTRCGVI